MKTVYDISPVPGSDYIPSSLSLCVDVPLKKAIEIIKGRHLDPELENELIERRKKYG